MITVWKVEMQGLWRDGVAYARAICTIQRAQRYAQVILHIESNHSYPNDIYPSPFEDLVRQHFLILFSFILLHCIITQFQRV